MAASCENLIVWLNTLDYPGHIESVQHLSNGVILSKILKNICPKVFNEEWQMRIKGDVSNNWRVKASNLKKVLRGVLDYYSQDLQLSISEFQIPDVNLIAEKEDEKEMGKLLQLVLGCAVNCDQKQEYIKKIMNLEEKVQHSVMISIKELMLTESSQNLESECHQASGDQRKLIEERNSLELRCHELDQQLLILNEEKQNLKAENEKLNQRLNHMDILEDPSTPLGRRMHQLQKQAEHLQEELFKSEAAKDDYRIKCEFMEKEIKQLQTKIESLSKLTEDSRSMKDELDILRHNSDKVAKYEVTISNLRKKLEDLSDLKSQMKLFEEKNSSYVERNLELEEELKKASVYKGQLEVYKRQVHDLQMKSAEENKKVDKYEFDVARCHERIAGLQLEKERLIGERDALKEINEELRLMQSSTAATHIPSLEGDDLEFMSIPPHIREMVMKLRHELKMLKSSGQAPPEEIEVYKNLLADADNREQELEKELRLQNRKILELEAKVEDLMDMNRTQAACFGAHSTSLSLTSLSSPQTLDEAKNGHDSALKSELAEVSKRLKEKEQEMKTMEQKYKQYLEKAKMLINHHQQKGSTLPPNTAALEERLVQKEGVIQELMDQLKAHEAEQKLMLSAFYNMSVNLHKRNVEDRLSKGVSTVPQSFLSKQRQIQSRRVSSGISTSPHVR